MLLEHKLHLPKSKILVGVPVQLTRILQDNLHVCINRLNNDEPIQYILGEAAFYGRTFKVNSSVLIPRPETEELVQYAISTMNQKSNAVILDIGTGSGCIAITLSLELPEAKLYATDVNENAVRTACDNATRLKAEVSFLNHNILAEDIPYPNLNLIISNPPYISADERVTLQPHVVAHEPHHALFAPGDDPLIFYKTIAAKGKKALIPGGNVLVEINERFGQETADIFLSAGYLNVQVINDISGKNRIVAAANPIK